MRLESKKQNFQLASLFHQFPVTIKSMINNKIMSFLCFLTKYLQFFGLIVGSTFSIFYHTLSQNHWLTGSIHFNRLNQWIRSIKGNISWSIQWAKSMLQWNCLLFRLLFFLWLLASSFIFGHLYLRIKRYQTWNANRKKIKLEIIKSLFFFFFPSFSSFFYRCWGENNGITKEEKKVKMKFSSINVFMVFIACHTFTGIYTFFTFCVFPEYSGFLRWRVQIIIKIMLIIIKLNVDNCHFRVKLITRKWYFCQLFHQQERQSFDQAFPQQTQPAFSIIYIINVIFVSVSKLFCLLSVFQN